MTDIEAVKEACKALGLTFCEGQKTYKWYAQGWMDDSPVPDHLFSPEETARVRAMSKQDRIKYMNAFLGKCDHAIKVPGAQYEVGLRSRGDGTYSIAFDWFGPGGAPILKALGGATAPKLVQEYGRAKLKAEAKRFGHIVESEKRMADGTYKIRLIASHY